LRIRLAIPDRLVTPEALEAVLEATTLANAQAIAQGEVPHAVDAIRKGIKWQPEPYLDGEHFDLAHKVLRRRWGDCDDLAPYLAGSHRASGEDPDARPKVLQSGPNRWHVVVERGDGRIEDPSKWAGMGRKSSVSGYGGLVGVGPAIARPFARDDGGALCVLPHNGKWLARCDVPWGDDYGLAHIASHARARTPEDALEQAVHGALLVGEMVRSPLTDRAQCAAELLLDHPDHVGSLFGSLLKGAASFVPGGSAALQAAKTATSLASKLSHGGGAKHPDGSETHPSGAVSVPLEHDDPGHGQHMMLYYHPERAPGPVIMRF